MYFDNFCSFFECHSILAEKQRTKQTNYSFLSLSTSLDTQDTFQGGIIVEWKNFLQEIPVCNLSREQLKKDESIQESLNTTNVMTLLAAW